MPKLCSLFLILVSTAVFAADEVPNTISVSGFGSVETPPDRATLVLSIMSRESTVEAAQSGASEVSARVLQLTDDMDIPDNRVDTMAATVQPNYRWDPKENTQVLDGYMASRQMRIEVYDLEKVGELIEQAVKVGVNQVMPPQLESSKSRQAYRDALERAAADAKMNAERIAESLGLTLGDAIQVNTSSPYQPPVMYGRAQALGMEMASSVAAPQTYNAGDMTVSATVNVVFESGN